MSKTTFAQKLGLIFFGLFALSLVLEIVLRLGGAVFFYYQEKANRTHSFESGVCRIMCLGESTTALGGESSYPSQLEEILNEKSSTQKFKVINKGLPSRTTSDLVADLENNLNRYKPQVVVTMMGINDPKPSSHDAFAFLFPLQSFLEKFRVYKLLKLVVLHTTHRIENLKNHRQELNTSAMGEEVAGLSMEESAIKNSKEIAVMEGMIERNVLRISQFEQLVGRYEQERKSKEVEQLSGQLQKLQKNDSLLYAGLARWFRDRNQNAEARQCYEKAIAGDPNNAVIVGGLGRLFKNEKKYKEAIEVFHRTIALNPKLSWAQMELARCLNEEGRTDEAVKIYEALTKVESSNYWIYAEMGQWLKALNRNQEAEEAYQKALSINPRNYWVCHQLGDFYLEEKKYQEAETLYISAIGKNPAEERLYFDLARVYARQNQNNLAKNYRVQGEKIKAEKYSPQTVYNYNRLADEAFQRGITLICMQYPLRSAAPLKKALTSQKGVIFVENEKNFTEALQSARYDEYFTDNFADDFGHCSHKGNRLVAQNLADTILNLKLNPLHGRE